MITLIYELPNASIASGVRTAFELYVTSGMSPKIIASDDASMLFDPRDSDALINGYISESDYVSKHKL